MELLILKTGCDWCAS